MACNNKNCGCQDTGLITPFPCSTPPCPNPEPCPETFSDCCVIHNGDSFTYLEPGLETQLPPSEKISDVKEPLPEKAGFTIVQGERLCDTWQRFIAYYECGFTGVETPYGLKSKNITSSTITFGWTPVTGVTTYQVFIAPASTGVFSYQGVVSPSASPQVTISALDPATTYLVCVKAVIDRTFSCASVSLILTTLPA